MARTKQGARRSTGLRAPRDERMRRLHITDDPSRRVPQATEAERLVITVPACTSVRLYFLSLDQRLTDGLHYTRRCHSGQKAMILGTRSVHSLSVDNVLCLTCHCCTLLLPDMHVLSQRRSNHQLRHGRLRLGLLRPLHSGLAQGYDRGPDKENGV